LRVDIQHRHLGAGFRQRHCQLGRQHGFAGPAFLLRYRDHLAFCRHAAETPVD
jgi:hypothetical protein